MQRPYSKAKWSKNACFSADGQRANHIRKAIRILAMRVIYEL